MEKIFEVIRIRQEVQETSHPYAKYSIRSPLDVVKIAQHEIASDDREVFLVAMLNTKNQVVGLHRAHVGSLNSSIVHPREVFKMAILNNAASIICFHQHPSGDTSPSREDLNVTQRLIESGKILGIDLLDHVIVSPESYYSMKEKGHFV